MERRYDLTSGPLIPSILRLAGPAVLMMLLQGVYNYIDTYFVGYLGAEALAGISTGAFILWMTFSLANLLAVGAAAKVARRLGERNRVEADRTALRGMIYVVGWAGLIGVVLYFGSPLLFRLMNTPEKVTTDGLAFLMPQIYAMPLVFLSFLVNGIFSSAGDTRSPFFIMFLSLLLNAFLDPLMIFGFAGFPAMGIAGASWATVIARLVWLYLTLRKLTATGGAISLRAHRRLGAGWRDLLSIARIGAPKTLTGVLFSGVYMALTRIAADYGTPQIAALRIGHIYEGITFLSSLGFSMAVGAVVGQNLGAGDSRRAAKAAWSTALIVALFAAGVGAAFRFAAVPLAGVFSLDSSVIHAAAGYLLILAWSQPFMAVEMVIEGCFSGAGDTVPPMVIQLPLTVLRWPAAYFMAYHTSLGVEGVWWAISGSSILKAVLLAWWFRQGRWVKKKV
ncbi:MAG: MATE family efflux transporter [Myxococcales bacterium]|nr:MATE family efflux transporter [Myxococcales bacterium]